MPWFLVRNPSLIGRFPSIHCLQAYSEMQRRQEPLDTTPACSGVHRVPLAGLERCKHMAKGMSRWTILIGISPLSTSLIDTLCQTATERKIREQPIGQGGWGRCFYREEY